MREESEESQESDIEYITSITDQPEVVHAMKKEEYPKEIYTDGCCKETREISS